MWSLRFFLLVLQISLALLADTPPPRYTHVSRKFVSANTTFPQVSTRIHGGQLAHEKQFPYMVFILTAILNDYWNRFLTCSASLIHVKWVLTAAHCVSSGENPNIIAVAGKSDLKMYYRARSNIPFDEDINEEFFKVQERRIDQVHIHPSFKYPEKGHDLALLFSRTPFIITDAVQVMPLSNRRMMSPMSCTVLGWGLNENDEQTFELAYAEPVTAQTPDINCIYFQQGPLICLRIGGGGICRGDSGSPLVCNDQIWGVASFSASSNQNPKCTNNQEEYFSQIHPDIKWIEGVIHPEGNGNGNGKASLPDFKSAALVVSFVFWLFVQ